MRTLRRALSGLLGVIGDGVWYELTHSSDRRHALAGAPEFETPPLLLAPLLEPRGKT